MKEIICIVLFFISGILIYQILKLLCKCHLTEGYGDFGRVSLGKCCPKGYKYSKTMKKCVHICDACDPSVYNKLTFKYEKFSPSDRKETLHAYFDCDEHDASTVHDFDSINRRYTKDDLLDQNNYGGWNMNSDFFTESVPSADGSNGSEDSTAGVQGAEEGGDETWGSITGEYSGASATWEETSSEQQHYFDEIPEELYYTSRDECIEDYNNFSSIPNKGNPPEAPGLYVNGSLVDGADCRGYWKLDMEDQRFNYLKDGDRSIAQPSWRVYTKRTGTSRNPGYNESFGDSPVDPPFEENRNGNLPMVYRYIDGGDILNTTSPIYEYYLNNFLKLRCIDPDDTSVYPTPDVNCPDTSQSQEDEDRADFTETLNKNNRFKFCNKLSRQINILSNGDSDVMNLLKSTPFVDNVNHNHNTICSLDDNNSLTEISINEWNRLCRETRTSFDTNNEWNRGDGDNTINILCDIETETGKLCPNSSNINVDPSKTFCST